MVKKHTLYFTNNDQKMEKLYMRKQNLVEGWWRSLVISPSGTTMERKREYHAYVSRMSTGCPKGIATTSCSGLVFCLVWKNVWESMHKTWMTESICLREKKKKDFLIVGPKTTRFCNRQENVEVSGILD